MGRAYLSLGSNIEPAANLRAAVTVLRAYFGAITVSQAFVFPAVGFVGADFLNAAAIIDTELDPGALNAWLHALEDAHGRDRTGPRYGDRPLDVDIVLYEDVVTTGAGNLQMQRNELEHAFVLKPLAEIAPTAVDPISRQTIERLWQRHPHYRDTFTAITL